MVTACDACQTEQYFRRSSRSRSFARIPSIAGESVAVVQLTATVASSEEAEHIATLLLQRRLVACVQIAGPIVSRYWWQGALESATEYVVVAKTTARLADAATEALIEAHSYDVPEVLVTEVIGGNAAYLAWVAAEATARDD